MVYTDQNEAITLCESIKSGGEGTVYKTNTQYVAKIYHKNKLTSHKREKIRLLTNSGLNIKGVCLPIKQLFYNNEFVGYLMPTAKGRSLDGSFFKGELGFNRYFSQWTRFDLIDLCINILDTINEIHNKGIIIGDINGSNILVNTPSEVYFVDTDSYQINNYPCPVGTETFTAPEIQGKDYKTFLRTIGNENFAVATLIFKILMFGMDPYAHLGGEGIASNIKSGDFSFPFQENSNKKIPDGNWKFFWSHLFFPLKRNFYMTFRKGECMYNEENRPDVYTWLKLIKWYKKQMTDGTLGKIDPASLEMFPKAYKKDPNQKYEKCRMCHQDVIDTYLNNGYCFNCLRKSIMVKCKRCGRQMEFTNYKRLILKKAKPKLCENCWDEVSKIYETRECDACGNDFNITVGDYEFFEKKGWDLPKRCKECRDNGYYGEDEEDDVYNGGYINYDYNSHSGSSSSSNSSNNSDSGCYITTAACEYYGKQDDCYELNVLRYFRDEWLKKQSDGNNLLQKYYKDAPKLVKKIKMSENYDQICLEIMNKGIIPCIELINQNEFDKCKELYMNIVNYFNNKLNT